MVRVLGVIAGVACAAALGPPPRAAGEVGLGVPGLRASEDLRTDDVDGGGRLIAQAPPARPAAEAAAAPARPDPLRKGSVEVGAMAAYSFSAQEIGDAPVGKVVRMYWLIPKIGYTFADFPGGAPYLGSFQIFLEPAIAYITHPARTYLLGVSAIFRHNFLLWDRVVPYIDGGAGLLNTNLRIRAVGEVIEFMPQAGVGVLFRLGPRSSVDIGWRYHHISNAGQTEPRRNLGINSLFFHGGFSYHF